jgi:hypothetical protein
MFEKFLISKKINAASFRLAEPERFSNLEAEFNLMGSKSFDHSKKFIFNRLRLKYPII